MGENQEQKRNWEIFSEQKKNRGKSLNFFNNIFIYAMVGDVGFEPTTR